MSVPRDARVDGCVKHHVCDLFGGDFDPWCRRMCEYARHRSRSGQLLVPTELGDG